MPILFAPLIAVFSGVLFSAGRRAAAPPRFLIVFFVSTFAPNAIFFAQVYRDWAYLYLAPKVPLVLDALFLAHSAGGLLLGAELGKQRRFLPAVSILVTAVISLTSMTARTLGRAGTYASVVGGFATTPVHESPLGRALFVFDALFVLGVAWTMRELAIAPSIRARADKDL